MGAALEQAALGLEAGEIPIGSVVAADGEIVARAFWHSRNGLLAHPELVALQEANRRNLTLVTTLEPCLLWMASAMFAFGGAWSSARDGSVALIRKYLERAPESPFARWAATLD